MEKVVIKMLIETLEKCFKLTNITSHDGFIINIYSSYKLGKENILIINPACVQIGLIIPLMNELSRHFNVVTFEGRGIRTPKNSDFITPFNLNANAYINDIGDVLKELDFYSVNHLIGYCSGGMLAIIATKHPAFKDKLKSISFVSSPIIFNEIKKTSHQDELHIIIRKISKNGINYAKKMINVLDNNKIKNNGKRPSLKEINNEPFTCPQKLLMYSYVMHSLCAYNYEIALREIKSSVFIIQTENDEFVNPDISRHIHKIVDKSDLKIFKRGGHFSLYADFEVIESILSFIWNHS